MQENLPKRKNEILRFFVLQSRWRRCNLAINCVASVRFASGFHAVAGAVFGLYLGGSSSAAPGIGLRCPRDCACQLWRLPAPAIYRPSRPGTESYSDGSPRARLAARAVSLSRAELLRPLATCRTSTRSFRDHRTRLCGLPGRPMSAFGRRHRARPPRKARSLCPSLLRDLPSSPFARRLLRLSRCAVYCAHKLQGLLDPLPATAAVRAPDAIPRTVIWAPPSFPEACYDPCRVPIHRGPLDHWFCHRRHAAHHGDDGRPEAWRNASVHGPGYDDLST